MANKVYDLIVYSGLADNLPDYANRSVVVFKQIDVEEHLDVPSQKPDIEQIVRVLSKVKILCKKVIATPVGESIEGVTLTGFKVGILGELCQKVEYVADEPTQSLHSVHFNVPFCAHIVLPAGFTADQSVNVVPYIEDVFIQQCGKRHMFKNVTILLDVLVGN